MYFITFLPILNWSQSAIKYVLLHFLLSIPVGMTLVQMCITSQLHCFDNCNKLINALPISNFTSLPSNFKNATIWPFETALNKMLGGKWVAFIMRLKVPWIVAHQALRDLTPVCLLGGLLCRLPSDSRCFRYIRSSSASPFLRMQLLPLSQSIPQFLSFPIQHLLLLLTRWYTLAS